AITLESEYGVPVADIPYSNRGIIYLITGRDQNAVEDFDRAILANPVLAGPYINRAIAYVNLAGRGRLNILTLGIVSRNGQMQGAAFPVASGTSGGEDVLNRAISSCSKAIELDGTSAPAYMIRGYAKELLSRDGACDDLKKAKSLGSIGADGLINAYCK
ncbi:MAG: tetratricopeptide repeat protein, partial [Candidatus Kapaibacterium sp.]